MGVSVESQTVIYCDEPYCFERYIEPTLRKIAVKEAREDGWTIYGNGGLAFCPKHRIYKSKKKQ